MQTKEQDEVLIGDGVVTVMDTRGKVHGSQSRCLCEGTVPVL